MARAFESLYTVTGDRQWLKRSEDAMHFIAANFSSSDVPGFITAKVATGAGYKPHPEREENILLVRTANLLNQYTGDSQYG
jgi:uncharacterized protein YyaL (SSP411 family)